jgi:hypothetical protein
VSGEFETVRVFTLGEARGLLPKLRKLLSRLGAQREVLVSMRDEVNRAREKSELGGGTRIGSWYLRHLMEFSEAVQEIESLGVLVKDFRTGLVDFPHELDGRIVYLCWKPDEDEIGWWHEVDTGFAGRHPLGEDVEQ